MKENQRISAGRADFADNHAHQIKAHRGDWDVLSGLLGRSISLGGRRPAWRFLPGKLQEVFDLHVFARHFKLSGGA